MEPQQNNQLLAGCKALGISITEQQSAALLGYLDLMSRWNKTYNLTAVRDPGQMVARHLLDSLSVLPHLQGERHIDVGTGGGLPGVPLAIMFPEHEFHLLDSNGKKTRFLFQVKTDLRLANMVVHQARVESFVPEAPFDTVISRAFASLKDMVFGCRHLLKPQGSFLAMKGAYPTQELEEISDLVTLTGAHPLSVPGLDEQRHLIELQLSGAQASL